ncbi:hypothetical protein [Cryobacterium aureum]|uniref:hypothetical protein n=1 Tax=Cryobacterium aureum TaxID=995037 RepID=UPI001374A5AA|nr:hypothetical protein [Cryobacterium aureum]
MVTTELKEAIVTIAAAIDPAALSLPPPYTLRFELKQAQPTHTAQLTSTADVAFIVS